LPFSEKPWGLGVPWTTTGIEGTRIEVAASIDWESKGPKIKRLTGIGHIYRLARFAVTFR